MTDDITDLRRRVEALEAAQRALAHTSTNRIHLGLGGLKPQLRAARRPKPLSLKEQALALIDDCTDPEGDYLDDNALSIIRRALEQLND